MTTKIDCPWCGRETEHELTWGGPGFDLLAWLHCRECGAGTPQVGVDWAAEPLAWLDAAKARAGQGGEVRNPLADRLLGKLRRHVCARLPAPGWCTWVWTRKDEP